MIALPTPRIATIPSDVTVATPAPDVSIVYVNAPLLSVVGAVILNAASRKFLGGAVSVPIIGLARPTFNVPLVELAA